MLKVERDVFPNDEQWEAVVRGVRNPYASWGKSDSKWISTVDIHDAFQIGEADLALMKKLANAGDDHGKFMRMLPVICDITAPLYWWKEADQYKIGTVTDSCSTMHSIANKEFTLDDFSWEHLLNTGLDLFEFNWDNGLFSRNVQPLDFMNCFFIPALNKCREKYLETKDKVYWWQIIQLLPTSYMQKRTWSGNYQVLKHIYHARKNHKLGEWHTFCDWIKTVPYAELITGEE